ncbi:MAG: UDP-2,3-diacylglucosamine diphosphatase [Ignavibacteriaceae bacterium]|nr:UDP-2,3-diacylglucosamine diphosphatase [Ignavibacteriaceae bacterium]
MNKTYFFISDIHLGLQKKEVEVKKEKILVDFLKYAQMNCDELFIVGDLFDYWYEYKRVYQKGYYRTLTALKDLSEAGIKIHYFIGNHDFLHRDFFETEFGAKMYYSPVSVELNGKKFFIGHGDGLVENDTGYNILKWVMRNRLFQWLYSLIHPDWGIGLASRTSKSSRDYTEKKEYGEVDGLFEFAKKKIDEGFDYVIFGHLHKRILEDYKSGNYINLGSWLNKPCYGSFTEQNYEIVNLNDHN